MTIKRKPKKLVEVFGLLKKGEIKEGLKQIKAFEDNFYNEINLSKSLIFAFQSKWKDCYDLCQKNLLAIDNWFIQNIFIDQCCLFVACSIKCFNTIEALEFVSIFCDKYKDSPVYISFHKPFIENFVIPSLNLKVLINIKENINVNNTNPDLVESKKEIYLTNNKDLKHDTGALWSYIFSDIVSKGNCNELKTYYLKFYKYVKSDMTHLKVAKGFMKCDDLINAQFAFKESLHYFVRPTHEQILPIELIYDPFLTKIADTAFCEEVLYKKTKQ